VSEGAQAERTALAWTRTALALDVAVVVALRFTLPVLGPWSLVLLLVGLPAAVWVLVAARRRYRAGLLALRGRPLRIDGRLPAAVAGLTVLLGVLEAAYVLRR
jgi:putative membrane protein